LTVYLHNVEPAAIYQLSISVGAALIGLIGIVFTLTLFVIQQISSTSIPGLLGEYATDRATQWIYVVLAFLALLALGSALIIPARHPFAPVLFIAFAVLGALGLLWARFDRVVALSDPSNVIRHLRRRALDELDSLEHLRVALIEQSPELAKARVSINQDASAIPTALALLRHYNPGLTAKMERSLRQLYALVRHFATEKNQDLFREAITATSDVLVQYVDYHGQNITMANSMTFMMGISVSQDRILSNALDVYSAVARAAAPIKDAEMSKATLSGLSAIAVRSVSRAPLNTTHGENATTGLIVGTMVEAVQNYIASGHIEGTFASFATFLPVITELSNGGYYQTARFTVSKLSELSQLCIVAKQPILATEGTATLLRTLALSLEQAEPTGDLEGACVRELFAVCQMQLEVASKGAHFRGFDVGKSQPLLRRWSGRSRAAVADRGWC
jgi:hypothetical protein